MSTGSWYASPSIVGIQERVMKQIQITIDGPYVKWKIHCCKIIAKDFNYTGYGCHVPRAATYLTLQNR